MNNKLSLPEVVAKYPFVKNSDGLQRGGGQSDDAEGRRRQAIDRLLRAARGTGQRGRCPNGPPGENPAD
eukprot:8565101-Pyramimonas_sp.AAC.1